jgi:translation initiation factor IF-3
LNVKKFSIDSFKGDKSVLLVFPDGQTVSTSDINTIKEIVNSAAQNLFIVQETPETLVCKFMDHDKSDKSSKNKSRETNKIKQVYLSPKISDYDLSTKLTLIEKMVMKKNNIEIILTPRYGVGKRLRGTNHEDLKKMRENIIQKIKEKYVDQPGISIQQTSKGVNLVMQSKG